MFYELLKLHNNSYVPISNFPVSACVVLNDGKKVFGVNVEDASTRAGVCAERNAIFSAITLGYKRKDFKEIHLLTSSKLISTPCFVCRQMISEMFDKDKIIYCYSKSGDVKKYTVGELCPYPFSEDDLK